VRTERAGQRVMESISKYITKKLKLKVNREKSAVAVSVSRLCDGGMSTIFDGLTALSSETTVPFRSSLWIYRVRNWTISL
jgi:hypothetical protein